MKYRLLFVMGLVLALKACNTAETSDAGSAPPSLFAAIDTLKRVHEFAGDSDMESEQAVIQSVIDVFREGNREEIVNVIRYPFSRRYPVPPIYNRAEMLKRFHQVFDDSLINMIASSKLDQWTEMGWRGTMLDRGIVWMEGSDGIISAVNYQSEIERRLMEELIAKDRARLWPLLHDFERPVLKFETKRHRIRVDEISDGNYRYCAWKRGHSESSHPDLVLVNGTMEREGTGGNHVFYFRNAVYLYSVFRNILGAEDAPDITLHVERNGKLILSESGSLLRTIDD
jgi:hypothetical protein